MTRAHYSEPIRRQRRRFFFGAFSVICLLAVLLSPAAFLSETVTLVRILRFRFRIRKAFFESLSLSVTLPLAGTVNDFLTSLTFALRLVRTFLTLSKAAVPVRPAVARKLNLKVRLRLTVIEVFEPEKLAFAGGCAGGRSG